MKFAENVLLEIVNIVAHGIENGTDVSEQLKAIDVAIDVQDVNGVKIAKNVKLSDSYLASKGRVF